MIRTAVNISRTARNIGLGLRPLVSPPPLQSYCTLTHDEINGSNTNSVSLQMINYALSHARTQKSDESYAQGLLILEQCLSTHSNEGGDTARENSSGTVLLAMATLLSERGNYEEAIDKLQKIQYFTHSSLGVRFAAMEALVGLHLELGQDDTSSVLADKCLQLFENNGGGHGSEVLCSRAKSVKGVVELVHGNLEAGSLFEGAQDDKCCTGSVALSYGEFLHATQNFSMAKELYQKVIQGISMSNVSGYSYALAACNMSAEEVLSATTCALGQLEARMGNFGDAEEILTRALTKTEEQFGSHHPKVGVVLTCIALMFRQKAMLERSSALLIQEGLYRRAIELLKAPPLENEVVEAKIMRRDIVALARGGYADILCVQQNRKDEGERMKSWAENAWRNRHLSLAEALEFSEASSKVAVIDSRIGRVL